MCANYILSEARTSFQRGPVVQTLRQKAEWVALLTRHRGSTCDRSVEAICYLHWVNTCIAPNSLSPRHLLASFGHSGLKKKKKKVNQRLLKIGLIIRNVYRTALHLKVLDFA